MSRDHDVAVAADAPEWRFFFGSNVRRAVRTVGLVAAGIGILAASSWMSVPFYPVPLTMQTLAVLLVGGLLGPRKGPAAVAGYLALGLAGAPVFHNGLSGPLVLLGPTGGYLLGFVPAAFVMGLVAHRLKLTGIARSGRLAPDRGPRRLGGTTFWGIAALSLGALLAEAAIYVCGVPWLAVAYTGEDLGRALAVGAVPYLLGDVLKAAVAVGALHLGAAALRSRRPFLL